MRDYIPDIYITPEHPKQWHCKSCNFPLVRVSDGAGHCRSCGTKRTGSYKRACVTAFTQGYKSFVRRAPTPAVEIPPLA